MKKLTLQELKNLYVEDYKKRPNNKSANMVIIKLIDIINQPQNTISVIDGKGGLISRGVSGECLVKMLVLKQKHTEWSPSGADMIYKGKPFEIKVSTSKGYAHYNKMQEMKNVLFLNATGLWLTSEENLILDKCGKHIQTIKYENSKQLLHF